MTYSKTRDWLLMAKKGIPPSGDGGTRARGSYLQYLPAIFHRELVVDTATGKTWVAGRQVRLGEKEFQLIAFLYGEQGTTVPETEIAGEIQVSREAVEDLVRRIRIAIESDPANPQFLKSMPGGYRLDTDEFMGRFLMVFESILKPLENTVDNLALYFDPLITPESLVPWLASWIDVTIDPALPEQRRRELVKRGAELYRWRGTRKGLAEHLRICTGSPVEISEHLPGMRLGPDTRLGFNTVLGSSGGGYHFTVTVYLDDDAPPESDWIRAVIEAHKPAHTVYTLNVLKTKREGEGSDGG